MFIIIATRIWILHRAINVSQHTKIFVYLGRNKDNLNHLDNKNLEKTEERQKG